MKPGRGLAYGVVLGAGLWVAVACGDYVLAPDVTERLLRAVQLTPRSAVVDEGGIVQFTPSFLDQQGQPFTTLPMGVRVEWSSTADSIASVDASGRVTASLPGVARVSVSAIADVGTVSVAADVTVLAVPASLVVVDGDGQTGTAGSALGRSLRVRLTDRRGNGIPGDTVAFRVTSGSATLSAGAGVTDAAGETGVMAALGNIAGPVTVTATATRAPSVTAVFRLTALAGAVQDLKKVSGDGQSGVVGMTLAEPVVVQATDAYGNPVEGAIVTWSAPSGDGTLSATSDTTDAAGLASARWTLGESAGPQSVSASLGGLVSVTFDAMALRPPVARIVMSPDAPEVQQWQSVRLTAEALDSAGVVIPDVAVTWQVADEKVASVDSVGTVIGLALGTTQVTASAEAVEASVELKVVPGTVDRVRVSPSTLLLAVSASQRLVATPVDVAGRDLDGYPSAWQSTDSTVATVDSTGVVTAVGGGTATILAAAGGKTGSSAVTVTGSPAPTRRVRWVNPGGGSWGDSTNWSPARVPTAGDTAVVDLAGDYDVDFIGYSTVAAAIVGNGTGTEAIRLFVDGSLSATDSIVVAPSGLITLSDASMAAAQVVVRGDVALWGGDVTGDVLIDGGSVLGLGVSGLPDSYLIGTVTNAGTLEARGNNEQEAILHVEGDLASTGTVLLNSTGDITPASLLVSGVLTNKPGGQVQAAQGTGGARRITAASMVNQGVLDVALDSADVFTTLTVTTGTGAGQGFTNQSGASGTARVVLSRGGTLVMQGGAFRNLARFEGRGTLDVSAASFEQSGELVPGSSPGTLSIVGDVTFGSGADTQLEMGSATPGTGYDVVAVSGAATLAGTATVTLVGGYMPPVGASFDVMTYGSATDTFSLALPALAAGQWKATYQPTGLNLSVVSALTPNAIDEDGGDGQTAPVGAAVALSPSVLVSAAGGVPVPGVTVTFSIGSGGGTATDTVQVTGADGVAQVGSWTLGPIPGANTLVATAEGSGIGGNPVVFSATGTLPTMSLAIPGDPIVGVGLSTTLGITLPSPAPVGGLTVTTTSDDPTIVAVAPPATSSVAAGGTTTQFTLLGGLAGTTTIRVNAPGYTEGTLAVESTNRIISLPTTLNVPYGLTTTIPIQLATAAPPGGVTVSLATSDASHVDVVTPTVTFAAGTTLQTGTLSGSMPGSATITATATGWVTDTTVATTTASLNVVQSSLAINASFGRSMDVELRSGGSSIAAPAGGVAVTLTAVDPSCVSVPGTVTIAAGQVKTTAAVSYGGSAATPCSTRVRATATNLDPDSLNVSVASAPAVNASAALYTGSGLRQVTSSSLGANNYGTTTVHIESSDSTILVVSSGASVEGTGSVDIPLTEPATSFVYYVSGMEGRTGTVTLTLSAPGFASTTQTVTVRGVGVDLVSVPTTTTSLSPSSAFTARIGMLNAAGTGIGTELPIRAGGTPLTATVTNSDATVAQLVTTALTGQSVTATIGVGQTRTPVTVAAGGMAFDPLAAGTTTVSASIPGATSVAGATRSVSVSAPTINGSAALYTGSGLRQVTSSGLGASDYGTTTVHIESSDSTILVVSSSTSAEGTGSVDIPLTAPATSFVYYVSGMEGRTGTVTLTLSAPGFTSMTQLVTVRGVGVDLISVPPTTTTLSPSSAFTARIGMLNAAGTGIGLELPIRAGGTPLTATVTNGDATVAQLVTTALTDQTVTATIGVGQTRTPGTVATGGMAFDPLAAGTTTVSASIPGATSVAGATRSVSVSAPTINGSAALYTGSGLRQVTSSGLGASNYGTTTVHIESSDSTILVVSSSASVEGTGSVDIPLTAPATSFVYYVSGMEGRTGTVTLTVSAPGFTSMTQPVTVRGVGVDLVSVPTTTTSLSPSSTFTARIGMLDAAGTGIGTELPIRAGGTPLTATVTNSDATVAQLVTTALTGQTVTATIGVGQTRTPGTVATGGMAFDPLSSGTTALSASIPGATSVAGATRSVSVSAPAISAAAALYTGSGLRQVTSSGLGASDYGTTTVHIQSSDSTILVVSSSTSAEGTGSVDIPLTAPTTSFVYYVSGLEGRTGTVTLTLSAPGFTPTTQTVTVRGVGVDLVSVPTTTTSVSPSSAFTVRIGMLDAAGTGIGLELPIRAGGAPLTATVTNSDATVAQLVTTALTGQSVTATIGVGQARTPGTVATGGMAFDPLAAGTTTVSASIPGATSVAGATRTVTVN